MLDEEDEHLVVLQRRVEEHSLHNVARHHQMLTAALDAPSGVGAGGGSDGSTLADGKGGTGDDKRSRQGDDGSSSDSDVDGYAEGAAEGVDAFVVEIDDEVTVVTVVTVDLRSA